MIQCEKVDGLLLNSSLALTPMGKTASRVSCAEHLTSSLGECGIAIDTVPISFIPILLKSNWSSHVPLMWAAVDAKHSHRDLDEPPPIHGREISPSQFQQKI